MRKITKKKYLRIKFKITSPLSIGSGENEKTDKDIIRNSQEIPYIPASAIAGVVREKLDNEKAEKYLGKVTINQNAGSEIREEMAVESRVVFYDANICGEQKERISIRDSVALDDYKTAKKGAKFDMEVIEPGIQFETFFEQSFFSKEEEDITSLIVDAFSLGLEFGTKTTRGYGSVAVESIEKACFDISDSSGIDDWLAFDLEKNSAWTPVSVESTHNTNSRKILLKLKQDGGISVRRYTTNIHGKNETMPDMEQLTVRKVDGKEEPVIPGTTWAGAIRHRMKELGIEVDGENSLFGTAGENRNSKRKKSRICFSESQISGAKSKVISRNAIDRFTGGTVDGALFSEKTWYGGTTELIISLRDEKKATENEKKALAATLTDLHFGFLAVGGETSIGRGLFKITEINGTIISETDDAGKVFSCLESTIGEVFS